MLGKIKYPIYVISKGRWENPLTAKFMLKEKIPFHIVIEPQEYDNYCKTIPKENILLLPFSNLGLGSYPARNWCWEDSIQKGFEWHHIFDDNIRGITKFDGRSRIPGQFANQGFQLLEKLVDIYDNIAIAGFEYEGFTIPNKVMKPFKYNTHVYSALLINNKIPYRWRLKYNEDVDLCLQVLHDKWNTLSLYYYCVKKMSTTMKMKGGNQDELYKNNDPNKKLLKTKSLEMMWPQYVKTISRFGRPHHYIDWKKHFRHKLIKKKRN